MREARPDFEAAAASEHLLSPRQRDVLQMVAGGKTNPEIAEALGVTLDGAKWNVSEILTKLNLATREEAAAYWRWRQHPRTRVTRFARGFATLGALRWTAGVAGAGAVAAVAVIAWAAFSGAEPRATSPLRPFSLEADIRVTTSQKTGPDGLPVFQDEDSHSFLRWWLQDDAHWKWEAETVEPVLDARRFVAAADGTTVTTYADTTNVYSERPFQPLPGGYVMPPAMSVMIGPVPAPDSDAFVTMLGQWGDGSTSARVVGEEVLLGRKTQVIEVSPVRTSSSSSSGSGVETTSTSGTMRVWLDPERMVAMKAIIDDPENQSLAAVVTKLEWDVRPSNAAIRFTPPPGATKSDDDDVSGSGSGGASMTPGQREVRLAAGFLVPSYVPEGFLQVRESSSTSGGASEPDGAEAIIAGPDDTTPRPYIRLQETRRPGGLPPSLAKGEALQVADHPAYRIVEGDTVHLAWGQDGLVIVLSARGVPADELLRVAESLKPSPVAPSLTPESRSGKATPMAQQSPTAPATR